MAKAAFKNNNNNKDKKKKARGKKARAKAKLERQWGERVVVEPQHTTKQNVRSGKSRLLKAAAAVAEEPRKQQQKQQQTITTIDDNDSLPAHCYYYSSEHDSSSSSSSEDDDHDDKQLSAVSSFLATIVRRKQTGKKSSSLSNKKMILQQEDDDPTDNYSNDDDEESLSDNDDHDDDDDDQEETQSGRDSMQVDHIDNDDKEQQTSLFTLDYDPYKERFVSKPQLLLLSNNNEEEEERNIQQLAAASQQTVTFAIEDTDNSMSLVVSQALADKLQLVSQDSKNTTTTTAMRRRDCQARARAFLEQPSSAPMLKWPSSTNQHLSSWQSLVLPFCATYADIFLTTTTTTSVSSSSSHALCKRRRNETDWCIVFHFLNHILTSRARIQGHNRRLLLLEQQQQQEAADDDNDMDGDNDDNWKRDQGYTRPTVLVLLPTRACCYAFFQTMLLLLGVAVVDREKDVMNYDRFESEYGPVPPNHASDDNDEDAQQKERRRQQVLQQKGPEWLELFGDDVNDDDDFKIGLALMNKKKKNNNCVKLFTDFYRSDVILASPLGLKIIINDESSSAADFLSSIEICYISRADVLLMQNWDHVQDVMSVLNQQPKEAHDTTDFGRVRNYMLAGHAAHWRQLIITSSFVDPLILSLFKRNAKSIAGLVRIRQKIPTEDASIANVLLPTRQVFQRVPTTSFASQNQDRIKYFADKVLPQILGGQQHKQPQKHTLIFIPSYFDFCSVRNLLLKKQVDFVSVTEYSRTSEVSRGRARFLQGHRKAPIMLYTGRAHFFHRHAMKGVRHVIFLGLPEYANFYAEHVNNLLLLHHKQQSQGGLLSSDDASSSASCLALFTKYDAHALERIVGNRNCNRMLAGDKSTFLFGS